MFLIVSEYRAKHWKDLDLYLGADSVPESAADINPSESSAGDINPSESGAAGDINPSESGASDINPSESGAAGDINPSESGASDINPSESGAAGDINPSESGASDINPSESGASDINPSESGAAGDINPSESGAGDINSSESGASDINPSESGAAGDINPSESGASDINPSESGAAGDINPSESAADINPSESGASDINPSESGAAGDINPSESGASDINPSESGASDINPSESGAAGDINPSESGAGDINSSESGASDINPSESGAAGDINPSESGASDINPSESGAAGDINPSESGASDINPSESGASDINPSESGAAGDINPSESGAGDINSSESGASDINPSESGASDINPSESGAAGDINPSESGASDINPSESGAAGDINPSESAADINPSESGASDINPSESGAAGDINHFLTNSSSSCISTPDVINTYSFTHLLQQSEQCYSFIEPPAALYNESEQLQQEPSSAMNLQWHDRPPLNNVSMQPQPEPSFIELQARPLFSVSQQQRVMPVQPQQEPFSMNMQWNNRPPLSNVSILQLLQPQPSFAGLQPASSGYENPQPSFMDTTQTQQEHSPLVTAAVDQNRGDTVYNLVYANVDVFKAQMDTKSDPNIIHGKTVPVGCAKFIITEVLPECCKIYPDFDGDKHTKGSFLAWPLKDTTKSNVKRKRRTEKNENNDLITAPKPPLAPCKCKRIKCYENITQESRLKINEAYWQLPSVRRRDWINKNVVVSYPKTRTYSVQQVPDFVHNKSHDSRRKITRYFFLPVLVEGMESKEESCSSRTSVCQKMFLGTLGYTTDTVLVSVKGATDPSTGIAQKSKRGKHAPKHKLTEEDVQTMRDHVNKYKPCISHYRRENAPNRLYLPSELSIGEMYEDYKLEMVDKTNMKTCSYMSYHRVITSMNISFAKLGVEECETCDRFALHRNESVNKKAGSKRSNHEIESCDDESCEICSNYKSHVSIVKCIRKLYKNDKVRQEDTVVVSCDLQKVILLPRLPGYKESIFTSRLIAFNLSFVPLGKIKGAVENTDKCANQSAAEAVAVCWHEEIRGRKDEDICSGYLKFLMSSQCRDAKHVIIWCDNCGGQNKCWTLYTALVNIVNCDITNLETVTIRYFEKGHSFMSADHFHAKVEKQLKYADKVYDFKDYVQCVNKAPGIVQSMEAGDFFDFEKGLSEGAVSKSSRPYLANTAAVQFRRGSHLMYFLTWQEMLRGDNFSREGREADFLQKRFKCQQNLNTGIYAKRRTTKRGITLKKKGGIVSKLGSLMPANRLEFYKELKVDNSVADLVTDQDY